MFPGRFLRQDDIEAPVIGTIAEVREQDLAREGEAPDFGWVIVFEEIAKPMVLSFPRAVELREILKSDASEDWTGKKVEIYRDPLIVSNGRAVGSLRFRMVKRRKRAKATR
jgi:hypothetical protein